jgi:outer membrane biogenesis lipoprotein LolB
MRYMLIFLCIGILTGCASPAPRHWQHKSIPSEQWKTDQRRCQRAAEKYLGLNDAYHADQDLNTYDERMRQFEVGKKLGQLVSDCMRKRGYVPIR